MRQALDAKDLGRWAELLHKRVEHWPYETHPIIRMLRAISHTHAWHTSVTPATALIYIAIHTYLLVCYAGKTTLATTQRLRKHVTTTHAGTEDSSFHDLLRNTTELHWTLVPVELVDSQQLACYRERSWWHRVEKWAVNDTAPALPSDTSHVPAAQHTKQLQTTLRQAHIARINRDYAQAAILNKDLERISSRLNIPMCRPANVTVPYMTPAQRSSIQQIVNRMVRHTQRSSWERQAIRARIRVTPSSPLNVRRAFERFANKHDKSTTRPDCFCDTQHLSIWRQGGTVCQVDGHYALLPVTIEHDGTPLRATDPLPCSGARSREHAMSSLTQLARTLQIQHTFPPHVLSQCLPESEWQAPATLRHRIQVIAHNLSSVACIRVADKSSTMMFAFCRQWVWDQTAQFLLSEEYDPQPLTDSTRISASLHRIIRKNRWPVNTSRRLPLLYLLGKAKSLLKGRILWRPIAAIVEPQVQRFYLRTAARAFTLLLRLLTEEITASFLVLKITDLQPWVHGLSDWDCEVIDECDCPGQFNRIPPSTVMKDLSESVKWLAQRRRWNAQELIWSIHRDNKRLDRAGQGTSSRFTYLSHVELENLVYFSLLTDTYAQASGKIWARTGAIPMGGPFSAQSADLRLVWGAKKRIDLMRRIGTLTFSPRGHPLWTTVRGNTLSLAQFRDNILVGAKGPTAQTEMQHVCDTLYEVWNLPVLCDCMTDDIRVCHGTCMTHSLTAMGFTTHIQGCHSPLVYAQPSGLTSTWHLKYTVTLQTPQSHAHKHISNIIVGAVLNVQPFLHTWISCLLSITAWAQMACLSDYSRSTVLRALHSAVPRIISRTPWDVDNTLQWCYHAAYILPCTRETIFFRLNRWVQHNAVWTGPAYASWHMPHAGACSDICADWCHDFPILSSLTPLLNPSTSIRTGPRPRGEGSPVFPTICELGSIDS